MFFNIPYNILVWTYWSWGLH